MKKARIKFKKFVNWAFRTHVYLDICYGICISIIPMLIMLVANDIHFNSNHNNEQNYAALLGITVPLIIMVISQVSVIKDSIFSLAEFVNTKIVLLIAFAISSLSVLIIAGNNALYFIYSIALIILTLLSYFFTIRMYIYRDLIGSQIKLVRAYLLDKYNKNIKRKNIRRLLDQYYGAKSDCALDAIQEKNSIKLEKTLVELVDFFDEYLTMYREDLIYDENRKFESIFSKEYKPEIYEQYCSSIFDLLSHINKDDQQSARIIYYYTDRLINICLDRRKTEPLKAIGDPYDAVTHLCIMSGNQELVVTMFNATVFNLNGLAKKESNK